MHDRVWRGLASDNYAGVHPEIWAAMAAANRGHAVAYGDDPCTASAVARFRQHFGESVEVYFVSEVRWMTSFDTSEDDIRDFVGELKRGLAR